MKSKQLRDSARGQTCTFQIAGVCNDSPETTVLCHLPDETGGMGMKSDDATCTAFGCSSCHDVIDGRVLDAEYQKASEWYMRRAIARTQRKWIRMNLAMFKGLK